MSSRILALSSEPVPALLIAMTISVKAVLVVVITVFILQFMEGNILSPFIVGRSLKMHPVVIMLALLAGGEPCGNCRDDSGCSCDGCFKSNDDPFFADEDGALTSACRLSIISRRIHTNLE